MVPYLKAMTKLVTHCMSVNTIGRLLRLTRRKSLVLVNMSVDGDDDGHPCTGVLLTRHHVLSPAQCSRRTLEVNRRLAVGQLTLTGLSSPLAVAPAIVNTGLANRGKER